MAAFRFCGSLGESSLLTCSYSRRARGLTDGLRVAMMSSSCCCVMLGYGFSGSRRESLNVRLAAVLTM